MKNSTKRKPGQRIGWTRYLISRLILVLFGLFLLASAEGLLRITGFPGEDLVNIRTSIDPFRQHDGWAVTRDSYLQSMRRTRFKLDKPDHYTRIFCLGGSTTQGYPFPEEAAWPSRLGRRLNKLYGDNIEVVNLGAASYGSLRTLGVLRGVLKYAPDYIIVAIGDAEFVEDSYLTLLKDQKKPVSWLRDLRLARLLALVLPDLAPGEMAVPVQNLPAGEGVGGFLFSPVVHGTVYRPDEQMKTEVMERFSCNLGNIILTAQKRGIEIVLCTLPSNLTSWPPDLSLSGPPDDADHWSILLEMADQLEDQGNINEVLDIYKKMMKLWDGDPLVNFRYGKALYLAGKASAARQYLVRARDMDPTPVRSTSTMNGAVRKLAQEMDIHLADLETAFNDDSPGGLAGSELILDYAHPTETGHALAERVVWKALVDGFAQWAEYPADIERTISSEKVERYEPELDSDLAFVWGQIYARKKLWDRAERMFRRSLLLNDRHHYAALDLAQILINDGRSGGEAIGLLDKIITDVPEFPEPYLPLAKAYYFTGDLVNAEKYFRISIDYGEKSPVAVRGLFAILLDLGNASEILNIADDAIRKFPGDCYILAITGRAMELQGNIRSAERYYQDKLLENSECPLIWENLGLLYLDEGALDLAAQTFEGGIEAAGSWHPLHYLNLGHLFLRQGDASAAVELFVAFVRLVPGGIEKVPPNMQDEVLSRAVR